MLTKNEIATCLMVACITGLFGGIAGSVLPFGSSAASILSALAGGYIARRIILREKMRGPQ